jgi:hypothetical protein
VQADVIEGKKYLALKPDAIPEDEVALGQMPSLKYIDHTTNDGRRRHADMLD